MQIGLIGLQNSGKSTLFNALANITFNPEISAKNEVRQAVVKVPDERLDKLTELFNPQKKVNAILDILDIPGIQLSDTGKLKITSDFLNKLRNCDALLHVVRQFQDDSVSHPEGSINVRRDIDFLETEFLLNDLAMVENRLEKIHKEIIKSKSEQLSRELPVFKKLQEHLEKEIPLRLLELDDNERRTISGYQFLSIKPLILGINFDEESKDTSDSFVSDIRNSLKYPLEIISFYAKFEYELSQLSDEEVEIFMSDFGITESALSRILRTSYSLLGLKSFFTVGEDECRAWTIKKSYTAQESAGVIHTDFYDKFIRAEVVHYNDYITYGSFTKCKEAGVWRLEGKEYPVKDGDILNIRHS